jgi:hypothetical protein
MWRAPVVATLKWAVTDFVTGRMKSSNGRSTCAVPWTSSLEVALKQMSMSPVAATAVACSATAEWSSTSSEATCAALPSRRIRGGDLLEGRRRAVGEVHLGALARVRVGDRGADPPACPYGARPTRWAAASSIATPRLGR